MNRPLSRSRSQAKHGPGHGLGAGPYGRNLRFRRRGGYQPPADTVQI